RVAAPDQDREILVDHLQILLDAVGVTPRVAADAEVLLDCERLEHLATFHDLHDASATDVFRVQAVDAPSHELDAAVGHATVLGSEQTGDGLQRRRLPRPVGAEERHVLPLADLERQPFEHENDVAVDDLDVVETKHPPYLPIHFMSRSTETSFTGTTLPSLITTSRARLVGRWSSFVYVKGGVIPHVSHSLNVSSAFFTLSPVRFWPARLMGSAPLPLPVLPACSSST